MNKTLIICSSILLLAPLSASSSAPTVSKGSVVAYQDELVKNWSLFSEYQKNGEYRTALPYGWKVVELNPTRFKTLYSKLAECYYNLYESASPDNRAGYADSMIIVYDLGIENLPDRAAGFWLSKAYALESYFDGRDLDAIQAYEQSANLDFDNIDISYLDRLGVLYAKNMIDHPEFRQKAIDLYKRLKEKYPDNPLPISRLKALVSDPNELIELAEQDLANDPESIEKIWAAATAYRDAEQWDGAERHLAKLVRKSPETVTYWSEYAKALQREGKFSKAISAYQQTLRLNPDLKENLLNISTCYRMMREYDNGRRYALRAAQADRSWGAPYMEIAEIYKAAVENCVQTTKGGDWAKLDFDDKLVYKLAQLSFDRARTVDRTLRNEATQRINDLRTLVPTTEDIFFYKDRIQNDTVILASSCYGWIKEPVPVRSLE